MTMGRAGAVLIGALEMLLLVGGASAQDAPPPNPDSAAPPAASDRPAPHRPKHRRATVSRASETRSPQSGVATAAPGAAPSATPGPGSAGGASGTASGIGGARRAGNVQGATASPTTPTSLPPGTLDLGNGLTFLANYTGEAAGNPIGGIRQGGRYADQFFLGADADLGKLIGLQGAFLHAIGTLRDGHSLTNDLLGNSVSVQEIYGGGQTYRLTYLSYEQKFFDDRVAIEVGRLPGQTAFLASPYYCNFQNNSVCGSPSIVFADSNFTYFPDPTWAGTLKLKLTDKYFFNVGAYEVAPDSNLRTDHGVDFFEPATGFNVPFELGYATTFANDALPRHYGIGAIIDRSSYADSVIDQGGGQEVFTGLPGREDFGRVVAYQRLDQMVWRPDTTSPRGLALFGLAMEAAGGRQVQDYQLEAGLVDTGPFASRPFDTIDFVVSTQKFSDLGLANIRAARIAEGLGGSGVASNETFLELNYGLQVSPAVRLTPNLQYIIDPDQLRYPTREKPVADAFVIGAKLSIDLFTLAGIAKGPGSS